MHIMIVLIKYFSDWTPMDTNPTLVFPRLGQVEIITHVVPQPPDEHLLIRTDCTLISTGTELTVLQADYPADSEWAKTTFPFVPGYNNIGRVVDVGRGVPAVPGVPGTSADWVGRRVATYGVHARYTVAHHTAARPLPDSIPAEQAAFFTIAEIVLNGLRRAHLTWGESVAVFGVGLLGQLAVRIARRAGARPVFAIDTAVSRLERLPDDGGIIRIHPPTQDVDQVVHTHTRGRKVDVVVELTGVPDLIPRQFAVLRRQGRFVVLSSPRGKTQFSFNDLCNAPSITIIGAHNHSHPKFETPDHPWTRQRHAELFFDWLAAGEIDVTPLISHRERFERAPELYRMLCADRSTAMGVVLDWS